MRQLRIALLCILFASCVFAKSGPRIPKPTIEATEAVALAWAVHVKGVGLRAVKLAKPAEYLLVRVEYVPPEAWPDESDNWRWEVEFTHPVYNDHSAEYVVSRDKNVAVKSVTE